MENKEDERRKENRKNEIFHRNWTKKMKENLVKEWVEEKKKKKYRKRKGIERKKMNKKNAKDNRFPISWGLSVSYRSR